MAILIIFMAFFADFAEEYKVKPRKTVKIDRDLINRKIKELKNENC